MDLVPESSGDSARLQRTGIPTPDQFNSLGAWFAYCRAEGFSIPVQVPQAVSRVIKHLGLTHTEAFEWLADRGLLHAGRGYVIVDLGALSIDLAADTDTSDLKDSEASDAAL